MDNERSQESIGGEIGLRLRELIRKRPRAWMYTYLPHNTIAAYFLEFRVQKSLLRISLIDANYQKNQRKSV